MPGFFVPSRPATRDRLLTYQRASAQRRMTMHTFALRKRPFHLLIIAGTLIAGQTASAGPAGPLPSGHDGKSTAIPAIIVGSGTHNLRIWSESPQQNGLNVLLGGLRDYEYFAHVTMIDLHGNTIVDRSIETPNGYLNMELTAETPLPKGTYLLTIRTSDRSWTDRIVLEH